MRRRRRTEITIEKHQSLIIRRSSKTFYEPCSECISELATVEEAATLSNASAQEICRWVEAGHVHFVERPKGRLLVCVASLIRKRDEGPSVLISNEHR